MIDLYYFPTPNGVKVSIFLEETGLPYQTKKVDIRLGDQFEPEFLKINPNNKVPAMVDHDPIGGGAPLAVFEAGAMLEYLADKTGQFLAKSGPARYSAIQWVHWQTGNLGPMVGNCAHFRFYAPFLTESKEAIAYGENRYTGEVDRNCGVLERQLEKYEYIAGDDYTIADMASWRWVSAIPMILDDEDFMANFPSVQRWIDVVGSRPAVKRASDLHADWHDELTEEQEAKRRKTLWNQDSSKVADMSADRESANGA